jgi:nitroreductase
MNETLKTIHSVHSTHGNFSDRHVSDEDVETILAASVRAGNAGNAQNYAIIVSRDKTLMKELCCQAPVMLVYCVDTQRNKDLAEHLGLAYGTDPAWMLVTGVTDAALAAQNAVVAARSLGIDSLITNGVQRGDVRRFWSLLDLPPANCFPVLAVYLGYASVTQEHRKGRLANGSVIHRGRYQHRDATACERILTETDAEGFGASAFADWRAKGHAHYLEAFFKGPGGRAATMYGNLASALRESGIDITSTEKKS